jgi:protein dithiol oxidoreductase (disulfide-forming)
MLNTLYKKLPAFVFSLMFLPLIACSAQEAPDKYQAGEGKDYEILATPVRTSDPDKIEVAEAFWYGCSHCFHFEPTLEPWITALPKDVYFVGVPVVWDNPTRALHAKMFYTAQQLKKLDTLHSAIFVAMNENNKQFQDEGEIAKFFSDNGVNPKDFARMFNSFGVDSLVKQSEAKVRGYNVTGTPTIIVNGKYKVMGSPEKMIAVANFLIEKERKAKK